MSFVGLYMPSICLIVGALFIKACAHWYQLQDTDYGENCQKKTKTVTSIVIAFFKQMTTRNWKMTHR